MTRPTAMPKDSKPALTPKLRFPEFRGRDTWERLTLRQVTTALLDGDWIESKDQSDSGYRLIQTGNIGVGEFIAKSGKARYVSEETFARLRCTEIFPGDCLVSRLPDPAGRSCFIPDIGEKMITAVDCTIVRFDQTKIVPYLFIAHSQTGGYFREVAALSSGSTRQRISRENLSGLTLPLPPTLAEQQKIAECLSTLDELIGAESQKLDALKAHKKGLMQQLFPREGETLPRLRFPEFQNAPEWDVKKLEEIGRVIRGASPRPKGDPRYYGGPVPRLMVQDVTRDGKWVTPQIDSLTEEGAKLSRPCPAGTLTIVCSGAVGVVSFLAVDACIHDGFLALVDIDESLATKDFLFHRLSTLREQFERGATHGGVFTNLTTTGVDQLEIACPSPAEQHRIATCLSSLDDLIAAQSDRLAALRTHKQGLLQQLFPSTADIART